jgi:hypothetical protein
VRRMESGMVFIKEWMEDGVEGRRIREYAEIAYGKAGQFQGAIAPGPSGRR